MFGGIVTGIVTRRMSEPISETSTIHHGRRGKPCDVYPRPNC